MHFLVTLKTTSIFFDGIQASSNVGVRGCNYDPVGLVDGEFAADGV